MTTITTTAMMPDSHQNCTASPPGNRGSGTFMPHSPDSSVSGMKIVATTVSTFMTSFRRLLTFDRCASRMPVIRSWKIIASSAMRTR